MLIEYLLSKKYREDYSRDISIRYKEADEKLEKIYYDIASELKKLVFQKWRNIHKQIAYSFLKNLIANGVKKFQAEDNVPDLSQEYTGQNNIY